MQKNGVIRLGRAMAALGTAWWGSGCLYTSHHFNNGRLLEPGHTSVILGAGREPIYDLGCGSAQYLTRDSIGNYCEDRYNSGDTGRIDPFLEKTIFPNFSLSYRLGVRGAWGPFTGVEMGWHLEAPTNPASAEFDLKFGLPGPSAGGPYRHSLSAGWIIGMWLDNSYFLEYAASRGFGGKDVSRGRDGNAVFGNYRVTWLATQPQDLIAMQFDLDSDRPFFSSHKQSFAHQASAGFFYTLPPIPVIPDFLIPQAIVVFPVSAPFNELPDSFLPGFQWTLNLGFGWRFL